MGAKVVRELLLTCVLALLLGGGGYAAAQKAGKQGKAQRSGKVDLASARRAMRNTPWRASFFGHQWRNALPGLREELTNNPDDAELHAYLAVASAKIGRYADALPAFENAEGSPYYESSGLDEHATTLRATGNFDQAIALRREALAASPTEVRRVSISFDLADDYRAAGDLYNAQQVAEYVLAATPGLEEAYALLADIAIDAGDLEEAELQLWFADLYGRRSARTRATRGRLQLAYGDDEAALAEVREGRMRSRNHLPWAIQGEAMRRMGDPVGCLSLLDSGFLPDKDRPDMTAAKLACLASAGYLDEAEELRHWAVDVYPKDASVLAASKVLDLALAKASQPQL